jgi:hypothetical protein
MRNLAAALLILTATTGCTTQNPNNPPTKQAAVATTHRPQVVVSAPSPSTTPLVATLPIVQPGSTSTPTITSIIGTPTAPAILANGNGTAEDAANDFVGSLLAGKEPSGIANAAEWVTALAGGEVIQITMLADAAGRGEVVVSIAFPPAADGSITDPVGVRVQLQQTLASVWVVTGIGYL